MCNGLVRLMKIELSINFNGTCREAVEFYAKVFKSEISKLTTYGQVPPDVNYLFSESDKDKICNASIEIGDLTVMFSDLPTGSSVVIGDNINLSVSMGDKEEVKRIFDALKNGGEVSMELQPTFFCELYGIVKDKFGMTWQISYTKILV